MSSSHSEAPGTAVAPGADITDLYAFRSYEEGREETVTFVMNSSPLQSPFAGPNYYGFSSQHFYQLVIHENDNTPCSQEEHVFSFYFGAQMGGNNGDVTEILPNFCQNQSLTFNVMNNVPQGIAVPINDAAGTPAHGTQFIPLKNAAPAAGGAMAGQNYFEVLHVDYGTHVNQQPPSRVNLAMNLEVPFPNAGRKTFPDGYDAYLAGNNGFVHTINLPDSFCAGQTARVFAGQRAESFSVNLGSIFDLIDMNPIPGFASSMRDSDRNNVLADKNVQTIAIEIPRSCLGGDAIIGTWARTATLFHDALDNHFVGVPTSRLGNPLVNEVVIGLKDKNIFTASHPRDDAQFGDYVLRPSLPSLIDILFGDFVRANVPGARDLANLAPSNIPRTDLQLIFLQGLPNLNGFANTSELCEMMRLNMAVAPLPAREQRNDGVLSLDTAGMPNGRRPGDDSVDIALRAVMGRVCSSCEVFSEALGLGPDGVCTGVCDASQAPVGGVDFLDGAPQNARQFMDVFPYLQPPHSGSTTNIVVGSSSSPAAEIPSLF